ncbi:undecaprenyl-diphosphate phosphatase [Candidatus Liberibacter sp.]|uniref:undecaprenyl-diphosphate phosphatase n=1 Tax=Candidatus Liberibacter sp. TaxID=34022 RepID=UPI0015F746C3|nr:undecaprenyl-diphosphate phosphatase [Candidatus Liberibacter sp.]MBA5724516.1 undecaprenyl-diphosphate phosphatase [Candidatus Liberibacter sp.]
MSNYSIITALILGGVEGLTEFIPVSSTAHLLIISHLLGVESPGSSFTVLVQLGALAALLYVYCRKIVSIVLLLPSDVCARRFVINVLIGFLPAAIFGFLAYDFIKSILFKEMTIMCVTLIIGGFILLIIDRINFKPKHFEIKDYPASLAVKIGLFQCLAMIPGTSRSGATIIGALMFGADKRSATEFSFFLSMPTIIGACALDFYKNRAAIMNDTGISIIIGCFSAFVTGLIVVRFLLNFISKRGYALFALWRIIFGVIGLLMGILF